jgi:hypothetical protein
VEKKEKNQVNTEKKKDDTETAMKKSKYPAPPKFGGLD